MIILDVSREPAAEMGCADHDPVVQALPPNAPDEALRIRILPQAPRGRKPWGQAHACDAPVKDVALDRIPVPEEIPGRWFPREGLDPLLRAPLGGGMLRHVAVETPPAVRREHDEHDEHLAADRGDREEIQRDELR